MAGRSPEEIRASIEAHRSELAGSLIQLRSEVAVATDWRRQIRLHRREVLLGTGVAGFVLGGGFAALGGVLSRRKR